MECHDRAGQRMVANKPFLKSRKSPSRACIVEGRMAKGHAAEYGRTRADEYRSKAEGYRVQAERASGDGKAKWLDLSERWDQAAGQVALTQAAVEARQARDMHV